MINPIYYLFYFGHKIHKSIIKEDKIVSMLTSLMAAVLLIHLIILAIVIKTRLKIEIFPEMNKLIFGIGFTILSIGSFYYLFERNDRYKKILEKIEKAKTYKKVSSAIFLILYFLSPLFIGIFG